jgi:hypothetical protein
MVKIMEAMMVQSSAPMPRALSNTTHSIRIRKMMEATLQPTMATSAWSSLLSRTGSPHMVAEAFFAPAGGNEVRTWHFVVFLYPFLRLLISYSPETADAREK